MKILVNALPLINLRTGIGRYVENLYKILSRTPGVHVAYYDGKRLLDRLPEASLNVERWSLLTKLFWMLPSPVALIVRIAIQWWRERKFQKLCSGFDIYHETSFFPFKAPKEVKTVLTVHDLSLIRHPQWHPAERVQFFLKYFVKRLPWVDGFLSVSDFTKSEMNLLLNISEKETQTTPLGIDCELFFEPEARVVMDVREKYSLPEKYFLCVGSGDPRKNVDVVLAALRSQKVNGSLVHVGWNGWEKDRTLEAGEIRLGYVSDEDLPALYAGAIAFVYPSFYEGFGLPLLEAMACGCPVVTTRLASLPEVAGDAALYLEDPSDAENLALILNRLDKDPLLRENLKIKGLERVKDFSWERTAAATLAMFEQQLSKK
ncbi:glycosyltransferase family 4 protein [Maridesulfovibrio frigidus]|uniref:glycosyltransferase family 4 protein n=1 Tax=Maridesulfovibrio frigidus TaxID=340956 RepID=UPI0004E18682|nr:glycosyltransferase family 1 protein [Maridesulfovibrio frigidus]